jgi:hypothetical protein
MKAYINKLEGSLSDMHNTLNLREFEFEGLRKIL